ncbi:YVTN family beta-propeller protein [Bradyrhizobium sp. USDA 10063]
MLATSSGAWAGQAPGALSSPDIPISHHDRVYAAEQFSNTVSVTDPVDNKLLGVIRLGDPQPVNFSPLYKGQVLVHGMGYSPDHRTLAVVSIGSNSVTFIDTATDAVKHVTYIGRSPHEAFYTPDGKEVWVTVRGENYISVIDAKSFEEKTRITTPTARACRYSRLTAGTATSVRPSIRKLTSCRWPSTRSSRRSSRRARSVQTSQ